MSVYNNELYNILDEDDNLLSSISSNDDDSTGKRDEYLSELQNIVKQVRKDFASTMSELLELRQVVYANVNHLSEKAIGDYAEIGFLLAKKYIRRRGVYIFMSDLMQACSDLIPQANHLRMVPSFKTADEHYIVTLLSTSTIDINFSKVCLRIAELYNIKEQIVLYVEHQSASCVQASYEKCLLSFENDYKEFVGDDVPIHYEVDSHGNCEIKTTRMELCETCKHSLETIYDE